MKREVAYSRFRRFLAARAGTSAVEFAIIALPLMVAIIGTIETGRALWTWSLISHETDNAVRRVIIANTATAGAVESDIRTALSRLKQDDLAVNVAVTAASAGAPGSLSVTVVFSFRTALSFVWPTPIPISQSVQYPIVNSTAG
ncbi:MAG: pilus assembly protein [Parvibaculum sp.]|nr:pilus assembly protein [Parvibaculum sp.]